MADRILALMGPGQGPPVRTAGLGPEMYAKVSGLRPGSVVHIEADGKPAVGTNGNGKMHLGPALSVRVKCVGDSPHMICTLHSK